MEFVYRFEQTFSFPRTDIVKTVINVISTCINDIGNRLKKSYRFKIYIISFNSTHLWGVMCAYNMYVQHNSTATTSGTVRGSFFFFVQKKLRVSLTILERLSVGVDILAYKYTPCRHTSNNVKTTGCKNIKSAVGTWT